MNKQQRKDLSEQITTLMALKDNELTTLAEDKDIPAENFIERAKVAAETIDGIRSFIEDMESEEQEKYDNMPEGFQNGEKGERQQGVVDALGNAKDAAQTAYDNLVEVYRTLEQRDEGKGYADPATSPAGWRAPETELVDPQEEARESLGPVIESIDECEGYANDAMEA